MKNFLKKLASWVGRTLLEKAEENIVTEIEKQTLPKKPEP